MYSTLQERRCLSAQSALKEKMARPFSGTPSAPGCWAYSAAWRVSLGEGCSKHARDRHESLGGSPRSAQAWRVPVHDED